MAFLSKNDRLVYGTLLCHLPLNLFVNLLELQHDLSFAVRPVDLPLDLVKGLVLRELLLCVVLLKLIFLLDIEDPIQDRFIR